MPFYVQLVTMRSFCEMSLCRSCRVWRLAQGIDSVMDVIPCWCFHCLSIHLAALVLSCRRSPIMRGQYCKKITVWSHSCMQEQVHCPLSKHSLHRNHFKIKQLSVGQCGEFAWPIWTQAKCAQTIFSRLHAKIAQVPIGMTRFRQWNFT